LHFQGALRVWSNVCLVTNILPGAEGFYADARTTRSVVGRIIEANAWHNFNTARSFRIQWGIIEQ
jgi:hypothetical protein